MRRLTFIAALLFACTLPLHAQWTAYGLNIPATHPRLWFNSARLSQAQTWYASNPFTPDASDYFNIAWKHYVTGSDCSTAVTWAVALTVPSGEWSPSGNGSDVARDNGEIAFVVYDWCYDQWSSGQKTTFITNWNTWLNGINQQVHGGPSSYQNNYNWGNLRNDIEYGITTYGDNGSGSGSPADTFLANGLVTRYDDNFLPSSTTSGAGGVAQEGSEYGSAVATYPMIPFQTADLLGTDEYAQTTYFKAMVFWVIYGTPPAKTLYSHAAETNWAFVPFGDDEIFADGGIMLNRTYYEDFMNFASNYFSGINVGKYARTWWNNVNGTGYVTDPFVLAQDSTPSAIAFSSLPLDYYSSGPGYLYSLDAWDTTSTRAYIQLGTPTGADHFHSDMGSFQLWRGGRWLTRETTAYTDDFPGYTGTTTGWGIASITRVSTLVTVTTSVPTQLAAGRPFSIQNSADSSYNVANQVGTVISSTQFTYTCSGSDCSGGVSVGAGGTIVPIAGDYYSVIHNMIGINGNAPAVNATFDIPRQGTWLGPPSINRLESNTGYSYADVDLSNVYQFDSDYLAYNFGAAHVEREFIFVRSLETLVVLDRLTSNAISGITAANATKTFFADFEVTPSLDDLNHVTETNGTQVLHLTTLLPATPAAQRVVDETACTACSSVGLYRLEVDDTGCAESYFLTTMQGRPSSGSNLTAAVVDSNAGCANANSGTFTVTLTPAVGAATTIVFNKGTSSSGGTINVAAGGAVNLRTNVEPIEYADSGPIWGASNPDTCSITSPTGGTVSGSITVQGAATAGQGTVTTQFTLDGVNLGTGQTGTTPAVSWNTATAVNGSHTLGCSCTDTGGGSGNCSNVIVTVSNAAPTNSFGGGLLLGGGVTAR